MEITIEQDDLKTCLKFSRDSATTQQAIEFGEQDTKARSLEKITIDNFIGKLGEVATQKYFLSKGITTELDFNIYPHGQYDDSDIEYKGWMFDVKATKSNGRNFLIEFHKLAFRYDEGKLPHFFIMSKVNLDEAQIAEILSGNVPETCQVDLIGFVDTLSLQEANPDVKVIKKGEILSGSTIMKATSFCVPFEKLDQDWDKLISRMKNESPFELDGYKVPGEYKKNNTFTKEEPHISGAKYSILIAGNEALSFSAEKIRKEINRGIKFFVFVPKEKYSDFAEFVNRDREEITVFQLDDQADISLKIIDGRMSDQQKKDFARLCQIKTSPVFNYEQYEVEHHNTSDMLIVKASAGTGKTTVMVDRIMYLLATVDNIAPGDIGMITFTNKATASMIEKLQKRIQEMYTRTSSSRWYDMLEQISDMQISTIDSFFKNLITSEGSLLGYGSKATVRSFRYEKQKIIRDIINEQFVTEAPSYILKNNIISTAYYVSLAMDFWEKLHQRGIFREAIYNIDFGTANGRKNIQINNNLRKIIGEAERRYQQLKLKENAYSVSDIKANTDELAQTNINNMREISFKYLFVDEFQDTDNSQINSIVWLAGRLGCQLFVVGDVKQSIYRFRGAEESAFDELKTRLTAMGQPGRIIAEKDLAKNYRTSHQIIEKLNVLFNNWADDCLLINYQNAQACVNDDGKIIRFEYSKYTKKEDLDIQVRDELRNLQKTSKHICMLSRSNNGVKRFAKLCRRAGISCFAKVEGGFYKYRAVTDFYALLGALIYPESPVYLYNVLVSPYTSAVPDMDKIASLNGDEEKLTAYFHELLTQDEWQEYTDSIRYETVFKVIEKILSRQKPLGRYAQMREAEFAYYIDSNNQDYDIKAYELNLNKLMQIIYDSFTGDFASLSNIYDFLNINIQTNSSEDMIYPEPVEDADGCIIEAMTVHKAKGLEFETVLLPYLRTPFFQDEDRTKYKRFIADNNSSPTRAGWMYNFGNETYSNDYYEELRDADDEVTRREEARILYVALTRAMKKVVFFIPDEPDDDTWGELLEDLQGDAE